MTEDVNVRRRTRDPKTNGHVQSKGETKPHTPEFAHRESNLTVLIETVPHIRAIYHIFVVILLVLLLDTVIFDLVEKGKINVGLSVVAHGFGDVLRGAKLWLYLLLCALAFYPAFRLFEVGAKLFGKNTVQRRVWKIVGISGMAALQILIIAIPVWDLGYRHLALGSSVTVTCEMFRFMMKLHAVAASCGPRCFAGEPLPSFGHYVYFLFAPTLVYRDQYPRTKKIRWGKVLYHFMEVAAIVFYNSFLWERFIMPNWSDYGKKPTVEAGTLVRSMFACVLPGVISFLCGFYCLLHAWLNAFAEMLKFGDRLFYEDWWTQSQFSKYFRAWNRVVHSWLRDYIYLPLAPSAGWMSTFIVFIVSAIAHEVILTLSFGFFYPVLLIQFTISGIVMVPLTAISGRRFPNALNLTMWLSFFIGNGILWSLYPMEYFCAQKLSAQRQ